MERGKLLRVSGSFFGSCFGIQCFFFSFTRVAFPSPTGSHLKQRRAAARTRWRPRVPVRRQRNLALVQSIRNIERRCLETEFRATVLVDILTNARAIKQRTPMLRSAARGWRRGQRQSKGGRQKMRQPPINLIPMPLPFSHMITHCAVWQMRHRHWPLQACQADFFSHPKSNCAK
jgi:hypothetical protein